MHEEDHVNSYIAGAKTGRDSLRSFSGQQNHYVADCTSADVELSGNQLGCRYAECDTDGIVKVDYTGDNGVTRTEVRTLQAGNIWRVQNVTKVYRYYVGSTVCTTGVYTDNGVLVTGLKLRY